MYTLIFKKDAERFLRKLDKENQKRILEKLKQLKGNLELGKPLIGNLSGLWSLRIGKYRVLYQMFQDKLVIVILDIGHRKNIY